MIVLRQHRETRRLTAVPPQIDFSEPMAIDGVMSLLRRTFHGQITIITQNFRVVQVERKENFNPEELQGADALSLKEDGLNFEAVQKRIIGALKGLEFGQVVLVVKKGRLAQIERLRKERYSDLQGVYGDGI
jgi:hypothetical protein